MSAAKNGKATTGMEAAAERIRRAATATPGPTRRAATPTPRRTRITLDLDAERYERLRIFALEQWAPAAEVLRALLDVLDADMAVVERIADRIAADDRSLTITSNAVTQ